MPYTVERDDDRPLAFEGKKLAHVSSYQEGESRWTELALYQTTGGMYVCEMIGQTINPGERIKSSAQLCEDIDGIMAFFGHRWLSKELYKQAGLDTAEWVD